jgi:hypothetical protein
MLDWLWRAYDAAYRRFHGLEDLPTERGTVLRVGVERYRGRRVALRDGTVVRAGDVIGTIHLHNETVAALHDGKPDSVRSGILILRGFERSLRALAGLSEDHPRYRAMKALTATTILHQGVEGFGFEIHPPPSGPMGRIASAYQRFLLARLHPLGRERESRKTFEVRTIWASMKEIRRRYGRDKSSPSGTRV